MSYERVSYTCGQTWGGWYRLRSYSEFASTTSFAEADNDIIGNGFGGTLDQVYELTKGKGCLTGIITNGASFSYITNSINNNNDYWSCIMFCYQSSSLYLGLYVLGRRTIKILY